MRITRLTIFACVVLSSSALAQRQIGKLTWFAQERPATETRTMSTRHTWQGTGSGLAAGNYDTGLAPATKAVGTLILADVPANTETVVMDGKTYTFQTVLTDVDGNVLIGANASDSIDNLIAAITLGSGAGTLYATSMTLHSTITSVAAAGDTMDATAKKFGTAGNALTTTETLGAGGSEWDDTTLLGATQWDNGDELMFDGNGNGSMDSDLDWFTDFSPSLLLGAIVKRHDNFSAIGSSGNPLTVRMVNTTGKVTLRGAGDVYIVHKSLTTSLAKLIVDGPLNVFVGDGGSGLGWFRVVVKSGVCTFSADMLIGASAHSLAGTYGPGARLIIEAGGTGPERIVPMAGRIENARDIASNHVVVVGFGTLIQTGKIETGFENVYNVFGRIVYKPTDDISAEAAGLILSGGVTDLRETKQNVLANAAIIGPTAQVIEGGTAQFISDDALTLDLRKEYP